MVADERKKPQDKNDTELREKRMRHAEGERRGEVVIAMQGERERENRAHKRVKRQTRVISNSNIYYIYSITGTEFIGSDYLQQASREGVNDPDKE